jgi:hypothetical protein
VSSRHASISPGETLCAIPAQRGPVNTANAAAEGRHLIGAP